MSGATGLLIQKWKQPLPESTPAMLCVPDVTNASGENDALEESDAHKRAVLMLQMARVHYRRRLRRLSYLRLYG